MNKGDTIYAMKDKKSHIIKDFVCVRLDDRDIFKIVTTKGVEFFYDEIYVQKCKSDGFFGWLFGR